MQNQTFQSVLYRTLWTITRISSGLQIFLGIFVWMSRATPDPFKKSLPKSNELLRMLVRMFVLDYCSLLTATIRPIRYIRVRIKVVLVLSVLFYTKNLHKGGWHLRVNQ